MEKENKCEQAGFEHAWENTTSSIVYLTNPPQYPDQEETCRNCGLRKWYRESTKRWLEYSDGKERLHQYSPLATDGHGVTGNDLTNKK